MGIDINPGYHFCTSVGENVATETAEGQCRTRHQCSDAACPLETKFTQARFPNSYSLLAPLLGEIITRPK